MLLSKRQKLVLELLGKYKALKQSQIEKALIQVFGEENVHIESIINQLNYGGKIFINPKNENDSQYEPQLEDNIIALPHHFLNDDVIKLFELVLHFGNAVTDDKINLESNVLTFIIAEDKELKMYHAVIINQGYEDYISKELNSVIFNPNEVLILVISKINQIKKIAVRQEHYFADINNGKCTFYQPIAAEKGEKNDEETKGKN